MATSTTNLGLTKPAGTDKIRIAQINGNMDILDEKIGAVGNTSLQAQVTSQNQAIANVQNGLAYIVGNTNTTGSTLEVGKFVYVKGHSTIAEGLRYVTASISANGNITTSNTSACADGGLNALNSSIAAQIVVETKHVNVTVSTTGQWQNAEIDNYAKTGYSVKGALAFFCDSGAYTFSGIYAIMENGVPKVSLYGREAGTASIYVTLLYVKN